MKCQLILGNEAHAKNYSYSPVSGLFAPFEGSTESHLGDGKFKLVKNYFIDACIVAPIHKYCFLYDVACP